MQQQPNLTEETAKMTSSPTFEVGSAYTPVERKAILMFDSKERAEREELLRRLSRKFKLGKLEPSLFDTNHVDPEKCSELLRLLRDPNPRLWRERILAVGTLGCLPLEGHDKEAAMQTLGEILANTEISSRQRVAGRIRRAFGLTFLTTCAIVLVSKLCVHWLLGTLFVPGPPEWSLLSDLQQGTLVSCFVAIPIYPFVFSAYTAAAVSRQNQIRAAAAIALGRIGQPESLSVVAEALWEMSPTVHEAAQEALPFLLPQLSFDHYGCLDSTLTPNLCRALRQEARKGEPASKEHVMALLQALEKVGDGRAVEPVQALITTTTSFQIRREAERVLPVLEGRLRQENDSKMLLRGASTPATKSKELLRAAVTSVEKKPEQLLRIPNANAERIEDMSD